MAHVMIIVPPLTGHINPTVALGQSLIKRGHSVTWLGFEEQLRASLPEDLHICPLEIEASEAEEDEALDAASSLSSPLRSHQSERRGFAGLHFLWEEVLIPLARATYPQVYARLVSERPDLCVVDQQMFSGGLAAHALDIPYVTSSTTSAALIDVLADLPQVSAWSHGLLSALWRDHNLTPPSTSQLDLSPHAVLSFSSRRLALSATPEGEVPDCVTFVGPALEGERAPVEFPWGELSPTLPRLFLSMGTVNAERARSLYHRIIEALRDVPIQVIASAPEGALADAPAHWISRPRVPQLQVLAEVDAVFCHGGHNTTVEALAYGLPLVIAPIRDDQPVIAEQVKAVGAGIRVHFTRARPRQLREAVLAVLSDTRYREAAGLVRAEFMGAPFMSSPRARHRRPTELASALGASRGAAVIEEVLRRSQAQGRATRSEEH